MLLQFGAVPDQFLNATMAQLSAVSLEQALSTYRPLALYIGGIVLYAVFIFKFYQFLAKRDIIQLNLDQYTRGIGGFVQRVLAVFAYFLETIIFMPVLVFFWYVVLSLFLLILGKSQPPGVILITAGALVGAVRITSYYNEELSRDLAKMIPFGLLGVFLIDATYFSLDDALQRGLQLIGLWKTLLAYLILIIALEFIMRILNGIKNVFKKSS